MDPLLTDIAAKTTSNVLAEVFKSCYKGVAKTLGWLGEKNKEHDFFGKAAARYGNQLEKRHGLMRIFGMTEPVQLRSIFTRVNVLEKITARQRETVSDLEEFFDRDRRGFGLRRATKPGIEAVNSIQKFILLGKPGAGKTTFLKYVALQALDGKLAGRRMPIFVGLKDLSDSDKSLLEFIVEQFDICRFPDARPFIEHMLERGNCIVLLDGLDEVSKDKEIFLIKELLKLSEKYSENHFIISCRIAAYNYWFEQFSDVEMADFDEEQIRSFVNNWFGEASAKAKLCWQELDENISIKELASTPLLLTLLCMAFDATMSFPKNRAELYKEALDALLKRWDASRNIRREEIYKSLSVKRKETLFSRIAEATFAADQYFLPERVLTRHISDFIQHLPESNEATLEADSELVLKTIEAQHGLFVERARGIYSFSHLTFQEYFTAKYVVDNAADGTLHNLVKAHLVEDKWPEVFIITAGMLEQADQLLLLIKEKADKLIDTDLASILARLKNVTLKHKELFDGLGIPLELARSLILARFYVVSIRRYAFFRPGLQTGLSIVQGIARLLGSDLQSEFGRALGQALAGASTKNEAYNHAEAAVLDDTILSAAHAIATHVTSKCASGKRTIDYLKANHVLAKCIKSECLISKDVRQKLLAATLCPV